jgi:hypothetical protein
MTRTCVFCGKPPESKTLEHVLPVWLIEMTGNPNREFNLTSFGSVIQGRRRSYAASRFAFPSCNLCNNEFSALETRAKQHVLCIQDNGQLSGQDLSELMDWLDKVRVGVWLGFRYLDGNFFGIEPRFHIKQRIRTADRALFMYRRHYRQRLTFSCTSTPVFTYMPSVMVLTINNMILSIVSAHFLLARRMGFPYPESLTDNGTVTKVEGYLPGRGYVMSPPLRFHVPTPQLAFYQCVFPNVHGDHELQSLYNTQYVHEHESERGLSKVLVQSEDKLLWGSAADFNAPAPHPMSKNEWYFNTVTLGFLQLQLRLYQSHMNRKGDSEVQDAHLKNEFRGVSAAQRWLINNFQHEL